MNILLLLLISLTIRKIYSNLYFLQNIKNCNWNIIQINPEQFWTSGLGQQPLRISQTETPDSFLSYLMNIFCKTKLRWRTIREFCPYSWSIRLCSRHDETRDFGPVSDYKQKSRTIWISRNVYFHFYSHGFNSAIAIIMWMRVNRCMGGRSAKWETLLACGIVCSALFVSVINTCYL